MIILFIALLFSLQTTLNITNQQNIMAGIFLATNYLRPILHTKVGGNLKKINKPEWNDKAGY